MISGQFGWTINSKVSDLLSLHVVQHCAGVYSHTYSLQWYRWVWEICLNTTNSQIVKRKDFLYCLCTSILDCFGHLVSPPCKHRPGLRWPKESDTFIFSTSFVYVSCECECQKWIPALYTIVIWPYVKFCNTCTCPVGTWTCRG